MGSVTKYHGASKDSGSRSKDRLLPWIFTGMLILVALPACAGSHLRGTPDIGDTDADGYDTDNFLDGDIPIEVSDSASDPVEDTISEVCHDIDGDGYYDISCGGDDCDDGDPGVHPYAEEICLDGVDQDCDGVIDGPTALDAAIIITGVDTWRHHFDIGARSNGIAIAWTSEGEEAPEGLFFKHFDIESGSFSDTTTIETGTKPCHPAVVYGTDTWGLAWDSGNTTMKTYFSTLDDSGTPVTAKTLIDEYCGGPSMEWSGSAFFMTYTRVPASPLSPSLVAVEVDVGGNILFDPLTLEEPTAHPFAPSIEWTGSVFGVAWDGEEIYDPIESFWAIRFSTVEPETWSASPMMHAITQDETDLAILHPSLAWNGHDFGTTWIATRIDGGAFFTRLDTEGTQLMPPILVAPQARNAQIVWTGSEYGMTWTRIDEKECFFATMDTSGMFTSATVDLTPAARFCESRLAWTGSEFGLLWRTQIASGTVLYFNRIGFCD